ncbi:(2Fe-2S)-binding protein [Shewanella gaetbuli]|uniref:(2Fe-2S)-binding protein n=1 Tax=Shewanella gaetbuli TaxID=220752 RepID=A0A9X1ZR27_9GAMM|nr:(2Fe-2S)-binding protein [Shewanella gaetbuli]MCL1144022.1 (2Fe-2S)-binding protein [Shewanella gaetbuli]
MTVPTQLLTLNGKQFSIEADPNMPVLWVIRDIIGLTGTKYGCGSGLCGACTIHVDGKPMRGCLTSLKQVTNKQVTTIEGVEAQALKDNWAKHNVPQCGYCQAGQIMSAAALLATTPAPTEQQIDQAMSGNICRCGTYPRIKSAIKATAAQTTAAVNSERTVEV